MTGAAVSTRTTSETRATTPSSDQARLADYEWLTEAEAAHWLARIAAEPQPLHVWTAQLRANLSPTRTHLLLELSELRQRARSKFTAAEGMFFTRLGLEQATDQWLAAYKARRFTGYSKVADLCCGIGGDLLGIAKNCGVRAIDVDPVVTVLTRANAQPVHGEGFACGIVEVETADCCDADLTGFDAWHIDPDRRPEGRRTTSLDHCRPDRATMDALLAKVPHAACKLAPATRVPPAWELNCELEWISRDRECRQLVAWHGNLTSCPGQRRATIIYNVGGVSDADSETSELNVTTMVGQPSRNILVAGSLGDFVLEPDPAVLAAGLTGSIAEKHGLVAIGSGAAYLTGNTPIDDKLLQCFAVRDVMPYQLKAIRDCLRRHDVGPLEIKIRGVRVDPAQLRKQLRPAGAGQATLLVIHLAERTVAVLANRCK